MRPAWDKVPLRTQGLVKQAFSTEDIGSLYQSQKEYGFVAREAVPALQRNSTERVTADELNDIIDIALQKKKR